MGPTKTQTQSIVMARARAEPHNISLQFVIVSSQNFGAHWQCSENILGQRDIGINTVTFSKISTCSHAWYLLVSIKYYNIIQGLLGQFAFTQQF